MNKVHERITDEIINKEISMKGIAVSSKAGACIKIKNNIVFIQGIFDWDDHIINNEVIVTGTLIEKKFIPDPIIDADGAISQGAEGTQFILENIREIIAK